MYVVVEAWTPKPAFLSLPRSERAQFFAALAEGVAGLAVAGVEPLGWGTNVATGEHDSTHGWFGIWQVADTAAANGFLAGVASSGWYDYFQQTNVHGELRPVEAVIAELVALRS